MIKKIFLIIAACVLACGLTACEKKGPAEKVGEKVDNAATAVKDAITQPGPAQKAGRKMDQAGKNVQHQINP